MFEKPSKNFPCPGWVLAVSVAALGVGAFIYQATFSVTPDYGRAIEITYFQGIALLFAWLTW